MKDRRPFVSGSEWMTWLLRDLEILEFRAEFWRVRSARLARLGAGVGGGEVSRGRV